MDDGYVVVIGSSSVEVKGKATHTLEWGMSNFGEVRNAIGGVARNIAENLARLEVPTYLLTAVGNDSHGARIMKRCEKVGIDCSKSLKIQDARTAAYVALLDSDGELQAAINDFDVMAHITPDYLIENEDFIAEAEMVVIDATLSGDALETLYEIASRHDIRVAADPTTPALAARLCPYIEQTFLIVPNASETNSLCGVMNPANDRDSALEAARLLVSLGAEIAVVTLGESGLAYADARGGGYIKAAKTKVIDPTGAGDAFSGAVIFGLLNDVSVDEAMRLGVTAASLTLGSTRTVYPRLSQELLYRKLMI